tara:strand:- start:169 stop:1119 length:951 start_codon:yes stop_codon:yes gene_type:complete
MDLISVRELAKKSIAASCLYYLYDDWRTGRQIALGNIETESGARHSLMSTKDSISYIRKVYNDYLAYGRVQKFQGRIAEIGPGDNFGVALLLLTHGAEEVDAIDRFYSKRDHDTQWKIYSELCSEEGLENPFLGDPGEITLQGLGYHPGVAAEEFFAARREYYDVILSRAVLEHLFDPIGALRDMAKSLKPGGILIHRIDLRDHGMFPNHHPLTHLTINELIYRRMTSESGRPNRILIHRYREWLEESNLDGKICITRLAGIKNEFKPVCWDDIPNRTRNKALTAVQQVRPKLARNLRNVSDEDLAVTGIVLTAKA